MGLPGDIPVDVAVLAYGDHPHLIGRCLKSLAGWESVAGVRLHVGLNAVSAAVRDVVDAAVAGRPSDRVFLYPRNPQVFKYPLMREMLRAGYVSPEGVFVWFDDDSFVTSDAVTLLTETRELFARNRNRAIGIRQIYLRLAAFQKEWVKRQSWYAGRPIPDRNVPLLPGSWWACPTAFLLEHDWPPPDLVHNGGDILFSLLCAQRGVEMVHTPGHVSINADDKGRVCKQPSREPHPRTPRAGDPKWEEIRVRGKTPENP